MLENTCISLELQTETGQTAGGWYEYLMYCIDLPFDNGIPGDNGIEHSIMLLYFT